MNLAPSTQMSTLMSTVAEIIDYRPEQSHPDPGTALRDDMAPSDALWELCDLYGSGGLDPAQYPAHIDETELHLKRRQHLVHQRS